MVQAVNIRSDIHVPTGNAQAVTSAPPFHTPRDMSLSPETSHQVGHIPELVHIIGDFLRGDDDFQSISRMAVACKMYKDDLAEWMAEKKESYRRVKGDALIGMTDAQLRLVR